MDDNRLFDGRLKLRHLLLAQTIHDVGTLTAAAEALQTTQPVLSRNLHELETLVGTKLFVRHARGLTPTAAGQILIEHSRRIVTGVRRLDSDLTRLARGYVGDLTVGVNLAASNLLVPKAVALFRAARPEVRVHVVEEPADDLLPNLLTGELDLMVGRLVTGPERDRVNQVRIYNDSIRLVVRAGHPTTDGASRLLRDLRGYPWVIPGHSTALGREFRKVFVDHGLDLPESVIECSSVLAVRRLILETDSISPLPSMIAMADPDLAVLPVPFPAASRGIAVISNRDGGLSPTAAVLLKQLRLVGAELRSIAQQEGSGR